MTPTRRKLCLHHHSIFGTEMPNQMVKQRHVASLQRLIGRVLNRTNHYDELFVQSVHLRVP
jgi:hypothetical protein